MRGEGQAAFVHQSNAGIVRLRSRYDDAVCGAGVENVAHWNQRILAMRMRCDHQVILRARQNLRNAENHLARKAHDFLVDAQDQRNDIGLAGSETHAGTVGLITQLTGDHAHPFLGLSTDIGSILQRA